MASSQESDLTPEIRKDIGMSPNIKEEEKSLEGSRLGCLEDDDDEYKGVKRCGCEEERYLDQIMDLIQNLMSKMSQVFLEIDTGLESTEKKLRSSIKNADRSMEKKYQFHISQMERITAQLKQSHSEVSKLRQAAVVNNMSEGKAVGKKLE